MCVVIVIGAKYAIFQFGRRSDQEFVCDLRYPFSPLQAFGFSLSAFLANSDLSPPSPLMARKDSKAGLSTQSSLSTFSSFFSPFYKRRKSISERSDQQERTSETDRLSDRLSALSTEPDIKSNPEPSLACYVPTPPRTPPISLSNTYSRPPSPPGRSSSKSSQHSEGSSVVDSLSCPSPRPSSSSSASHKTREARSLSITSSTSATGRKTVFFPPTNGTNGSPSSSKSRDRTNSSSSSSANRRRVPSLNDSGTFTKVKDYTTDAASDEPNVRRRQSKSDKSNEIGRVKSKGNVSGSSSSARERVSSAPAVVAKPLTISTLSRNSSHSPDRMSTANKRIPVASNSSSHMYQHGSNSAGHLNREGDSRRNRDMSLSVDGLPIGPHSLSTTSANSRVFRFPSVDDVKYDEKQSEEYEDDQLFHQSNAFSDGTVSAGGYMVVSHRASSCNISRSSSYSKEGLASPASATGLGPPILSRASSHVSNLSRPQSPCVSRGVTLMKNYNTNIASRSTGMPPLESPIGGSTNGIGTCHSDIPLVTTSSATSNSCTYNPTEDIYELV